MAGSVFVHALREQRLSLIGWGAALAAPAALNVAVFPSLQDLPELVDFIRSLPPVIQHMIGDPEALTGLEGFLRLKLFSSWLPFLLSLFALLQASSALAGERERGTMDLLLAQPVERWRVVVEKFAAVAVAVVLLCTVVGGALLIAVSLVGLEADRVWMVSATYGAVPLVLVFGALGFLVSANVSRARPALMTGGVALAAAIFLETLAPIAPALGRMRPLSPLYYHDQSLPLGGDLVLGPILVLLAFSAALLAAAAWTFQRRDLTV